MDVVSSKQPFFVRFVFSQTRKGNPGCQLAPAPYLCEGTITTTNWCINSQEKLTFLRNTIQASLHKSNQQLVPLVVSNGIMSHGEKSDMRSKLGLSCLQIAVLDQICHNADKRPNLSKLHQPEIYITCSFLC